MIAFTLSFLAVFTLVWLVLNGPVRTFTNPGFWIGLVLSTCVYLSIWWLL